MSEIPAMRITVDDVELAYEDEGAGDALVLIHGFPLSHATWDEQAEVLQRDCRVIRPDLRGLGASSVPPGPYLMETLAGDLAALLDALGIETATIAGHSLGGYVALAFFRLYAERTRGLALVSSRVAADPPEGVRARLALADRIEREGMPAFLEYGIPLFFAERVYDERPDLVKRAREIAARSDPRGAAAMYRGMAARVSSEDVLEDLDVPFLVVSGTDDRLIDPALQKYAADAVPHARHVELARCGHFPLYERPAETAAALLELVRAGA